MSNQVCTGTLIFGHNISRQEYYKNNELSKNHRSKFIEESIVKMYSLFDLFLLFFLNIIS